MVRNARKMTNAERIRKMSVRKLAEIIKFCLECDKCPRKTDRGCDGDCAAGAREWLRQEVSDDKREQNPGNV